MAYPGNLSSAEILMYLEHSFDDAEAGRARQALEVQLQALEREWVNVQVDVGASEAGVLSQLSTFFAWAHKSLNFIARFVFHPDLLAIRTCAEAFEALPERARMTIAQAHMESPWQVLADYANLPEMQAYLNTVDEGLADAVTAVLAADQTSTSEDARTLLHKLTVSITQLWTVSKDASHLEDETHLALQRHVASRAGQLLEDPEAALTRLGQAVAAVLKLLREDHVTRMIALRSSITALARANPTVADASALAVLSGEYGEGGGGRGLAVAASRFDAQGAAIAATRPTRRPGSCLAPVVPGAPGPRRRPLCTGSPLR
eukprot:CAMPEP_0198432824 /NCGR_PEP_ID=MMETSP1452-20131203/24251_1 /TAXON_ID=1181717 /ORGANISM="Synchroma pusillum, Strain CCMP3072" /LENGTH=317 /DNA_ID=CAMNT_0044153309 /DNA_START=60 /DNA_END=1014 /DNA_ORIENTATION=-